MTARPHATARDQRPETRKHLSKASFFRSLVSGLRTSRPGTTLIELLIFLAIMAMVVSLTLPMLFTAAENRVLQQTISVVEQNGTQVIQNIGFKIRNAEKIVYPAAGQTGKYLVLQTGSGGTNPTIIGTHSGSVVIVQRAVKETISNEQVGIAEFRVRNTSTSSTSQSVAVSFLVTRTIRLQQPHSYTQRFDVTLGLLPDEEQVGSCNCPSVSCTNGTAIVWYVCDTGICEEATTALDCS